MFVETEAKQHDPASQEELETAGISTTRELLEMPDGFILVGKNLTRKKEFDELRNTLFPKAVEAYLVFISVLSPSLRDEDFIKLRAEHLTIKTRKNKAAYVHHVRKACELLLDIPEGCLDCVDPIDIVLISWEGATNPCFKNGNKQLQLVRKIVSTQNPETFRLVQLGMQKIKTRYRNPGILSQNWKDALKIFDANPGLFGISMEEKV